MTNDRKLTELLGMESVAEFEVLGLELVTEGQRIEI